MKREEKDEKGEGRRNIPKRVAGLNWVYVVAVEHRGHSAAGDDVHSLQQVALLYHHIPLLVLAHDAHLREVLLVHGV